MFDYTKKLATPASATLMLVVALGIACSYAKGPPYVVEGQPFPAEKLKLVETGMTASQVRDLLGEPLETRESGNALYWRYYVHQRQEETVRYLGIVPHKKPFYNGVKEAEIAFRNGLVETVRFDHRTPEAEKAEP